MEALLDCIDEIALDGLDGCPIQELWRHLAERSPPFSLKLDDAAKQFLWKAIVRTPEVEFFVLTEPFAHLFDPKCDEFDKYKPKNPLDQFQGPLKDSNDFKLVSDGQSGIRGSCPSYFIRKNVTQDIRGQAEYLSMETAYQRWGDCLVMVASQELREKALLGVNCDPNVVILDIQYCLLEHIGQARYKGRMQKAIGSNFVKIESKSVFHHLKKLRQEHLITMQHVVITTYNPSRRTPSQRDEGVRNFSTNIVRLKRFHVYHHHKYDVLAASLCNLLLAAPNQALPLSDILRHARESSKKTVKRVRQFLQQAGYIVEEKMEAVSHEAASSEEFCPPKAKKKKKKKKKEFSMGTTADTIKVRLLKPFVLKTDRVWQHSDDDEEDDDGDGDREMGAWGNDYQSNLVAERPLINQMYDLVCQAGSHGCTLKKFQEVSRLPFLDVRAIVKDMTRKKLVQEVHQDIAKTKVAWVVATPFVESNIQTMKMKQVQEQLKEMETKAIESKTPQGTPRGSPHPSPCPSPTPSEGLDVKEKKPLRSKSVIAERVTYRKLKRKKVILEYIQNMKVVEGTYPILKAVIAREEEEGYPGKMDRKVLSRILDDLCSQGLVRQLKTVIHHGTVSQAVDLYLHSPITNDHPQVAQTLEQCRARMRDDSYKAAERQEKARQNAEEKERKKIEKTLAAAEEKEKKKIEKEGKEAQKKVQQQQQKEASEKAVEEQATAAEHLEKKFPPRKYSFLPRFSRVQALHELLWQLVYGHATPELLDTPSEMTRDMGKSLEENDEWMKHLRPLAKVYDGDGQPLQGWFRFSDVLRVMPLSILCRAVDNTEEIEGLQEYAFDPVKKNTLISDLPQPLKSKVVGHRKVKATPFDLLCTMSQMGLITPSLPFPHTYKDVKIFLNKGVKLLDTTSSLPGYRTASPPPDKPFTLRTHMFTSMAAVKSYWTDLKCVCLNTPLGVVRNQKGIDDTEPVGGKDRRLVYFAKEEVDENRVDFPPGDQLGAGGLDRGLYSHLHKNWTRIMAKLRDEVQEKRKLPTTTTIMAAEAKAMNSGTSGSSLPGDGEKSFLTFGRAEMKKQAKKGSLKRQKKRCKRKAEDSQESKGVKKIRTDLTDKAKTSEQIKGKQKHLLKTGHLNAIDEEDRNILARKAAERITFSAEEDSWLLLFRIALGIMKNELSRFYPFVCMRNILHQACASSFDKTAPSIQRRILKLMRNPHSQMTVKICSAECAHDESFKGFDDPKAEFEGTFKEVVKRLRQKFSSSSLSCNGDLPLVSSVKELHDKYKVQTLVSKDTSLSDESIRSLGPAVKSVSDINKASIRDQIQIAFMTPQEIYDAYRVFQMFNSFTREELQDVFKDMQKKNLVRRKRSCEQGSKPLTRSLPFATMTYQLSQSYHRLFLQGFKLVTFYKDCASFWTQLVEGEEHGSHEPSSSSSINPGTMEIKPKNTLGGHVACIFSLLATDKVSVEVSIPDEILNLDPSELKESTENFDAQQQTSQETTNDHGNQSTVVTANGREKGSTLSPIKRTAAPSAIAQGNSSKVDEPPSSMKGQVVGEKSEAASATPSPNAKSHVKRKPDTGASVRKEKRIERREVLTLNLPSSTVTKFTSAYDLTSAKQGGDYLTSCTETVEVAKSTSVSTVPVAALPYSSTTSRSSRTTLMLARGGKDPYVSINQLPARAFNTHDFMTLYPCTNVLRLKDDSDGKVQNEKDVDDSGITSSEEVSVTRPEVGVTSTSAKTQTVGSSSLDDAFDDSATSPVIVSPTVSLDDYIELRKRELAFNEMDVLLARDIHDLVDQGKEFGVPVAQLQERIHESRKQELKSSQYSFEQHVKYLCAFKLLYRVGFYDLCLVSANFVKPWCVKLLKPKSSSQQAESGEVVDDKSVSCASDSLNTKKTDSKDTPNKQEDAESNDLEITGIVTKETSHTAQTGFTSVQVIDECSASPSLDGDTTYRENDSDSRRETTGQTGLSSEPDDLSSKEKEESQGRRKKSKVRNYDSYSVVCRPWITIDGTTSQQLLRMFREMVLMLILDNPGIPESQVASRVFEALRPVALHDILESLIVDGCIVKHVRKVPSKTPLFSASRKAVPTENMTFYTPTVDCIFKLATSKRTGYT